MYNVYIYQNRINNKIYVGKTVNITKRKMHHKLVAKYGKEKYNNSYSYLHRAMSKHGFVNFDFHIIENHETFEACEEAEQFWIEYFPNY